MNRLDQSDDTLASCLVNLQTGEETLDRLSLSLMRTCNEYDVEGEGENATSCPVGENILHNYENNKNGSKQYGLKLSQTYPERGLPILATNASSLNLPYHPASSTVSNTESEKLPEYFEDVPDAEDKVPASGGGMKGCLHSRKMPYLEAAPKQSEMLLHLQEFPATSGTKPVTRDPSDELSMKVHGYSSPSQNQSPGESLPSIMSWGVGGGEAACSSISQSSAAWASAYSTCESDKISSPYFIPAARSPSYDGNSELDKQFCYFKDYKAYSYPELLDQQKLSDVSSTGMSENALNSVNHMNIKYESRHRSRNRVSPYTGNKSYPVIAGNGRKNSEAETLKHLKEDIHCKFQKKRHLLQLPHTTSLNDPRSEVKFFSSSVGKPGITTPFPQVMKGSNASEKIPLIKSTKFTVEDARRISPRKALLQRVVNSTLAFRSHPLFPLLRDLVVAEHYYDKASFHISTVLQYMPSSTNDLISMFLRRNPDSAYTFHTSKNHNNAIESVIRDVVIYAHQCLLERIKSQATKKSSQRAEEGGVEAKLEKICLGYSGAVRSSTPAPILHSLCVNSSSALNGYSLRCLDQILEPLSPIPPSMDLTDVSSLNQEMPLSAQRQRRWEPWSPNDNQY